MCGVYASVNLCSEKESVSNLRSFSYRGPDHTGWEVFDGVFLGNNRLSIIDLEERSNQPFVSKNKQHCLVFNGEIYNYKEIKTELEKKGYSFLTESDTEVVLVSYQEWGSAAFKKFRGMFAVIIYDKARQELVLARDHVGMKPLYFFNSVGVGIVAASEMKGIIRAVPKLELSKEAFLLAEALGYIPSPMTLYKDVYKVEKGTILRYDLQAHKISSVEHYNELVVSEITSQQQLHDTLQTSIERHLVANVPVGLFFSGGTDSTLVAALLKERGVQLKSYSIIMDHKDDDEYHIGEIGSCLGLDPIKLFFNQAVFDISLEETSYLFDEPTLDSSMLAIYSLSKKAREDVKVVLSGEGGDEFFYGYTRHLPLFHLKKSKNKYLLEFIKTLPCTSSYKKRLYAKISLYFGLGYDYYLTQTSKGPLTHWGDVLDMFFEYDSKPVNLDQDFYLENDLLRKMDFATSYASVEGRMPLLDVDVINASRNFADTVKDTAIGKKVLKDILSRYIDEGYIFRKKSGLGLNQKVLFESSAFFMSKFTEALSELSARDLPVPGIGQSAARQIVRQQPYYAYLLFTYWLTIENLERTNTLS